MKWASTLTVLGIMVTSCIAVGQEAKVEVEVLSDVEAKDAVVSRDQQSLINDVPGWVSLFDGTMDGWKASENSDSWSVEDGCFVCHGERSHLFYVGDKAPFKNFEFKCQVKTLPKSNAGIYFHTKYQEKGWPKYGYECQVNQTHGDPKKSSSLYGEKNVDDSGVPDGEWYTQHIIVKGRRIILKINDKVMVDYTEPENKEAFSEGFERRLDPEGGTFAFQAHDPISKAYFKDIMVRKLP